jgi:phosphoribosylanthranilate isomerase
MQSPKVKVCGLARLDDALLAVELGAWAVGMVFYEPSPRSCPPDQAELIALTLKRRVELAGVFVNASLAEIARRSDQLGLTLVQLHGDEGPSFCAEVARRTGARVIKAAPIAGPGALQDLKRFHTDFHLLDGHTPGLRGGGGQTFEWELLAGRRSTIPAILSGGLNPQNVRHAIELAHPFGVDVASGVESSPGVKDPAKLRAFFAAARPADLPADLAAADPADLSADLAAAHPADRPLDTPVSDGPPADTAPNEPQSSPAEALA